MPSISSSSPPDVVIGYVTQDLKLVKLIADNIKKADIDISVWYHDQTAKTAKQDAAQVLISCKVYMVVLSDSSATDDNIRDQVALAYVSNKSIIPVACKYYKAISPHLDGGMKLMLSKINWIFFANEAKYEQNLKELFEVTKVLIAYQEDGCDGGELGMEAARMNLQSHFVLGQEEDQESFPETRGFWDRHFGEDTTWVEFKEKFLADYGEKIENDFGEDQKKFFVGLIYKDAFDLRKNITKRNYDKFCGDIENELPDQFFKLVQDYVVGYFAIREVFDMESSVRLTAIRNLGSFQTPAVIGRLLELVKDPDPNIRAVASLALAKTGKQMSKIEDALLSLLDDEDRLVRESACLSLGHMKCTRSLDAIMNLWRNDAISHVRNAAEVAISKMGGEEASEAMKITKILTTEVSKLKAATSTK